MLIESSVIKDIVQTQLNKFREASKISNNQRSVKDKLNGVIQALELINAGIIYSEKKGDNTMEDVKIMTDKIVDIDDLKKKSVSTIDSQIIESAKRVEPGKANLANVGKVNWNTFQNRVYTLVKENKLPEAFRPLRSEGQFYLANDVKKYEKSKKRKG